MKKLSFFATLAIAVALAVACDNSKPKSADDDEEEQVDLSAYGDVELTNSLDTVSYAAGVEIGKQFKDYNVLEQLHVDTTYMEAFIKGVIEATSIEGDKEAEARLAGLQIGSQLTQVAKSKAQQLFSGDTTKTISREQFVAAFLSVLNDGELLIAGDEVQSIQERFTAEQKETLYADSKEDNEEFLRNNARKEGVLTTSSGLQFKVIRSANGAKPTADSRVRVHYEGRLIDGTVFDSSYMRGEPIVFGLNQVIKGWTEGLQLMPVGSEYELYIPQELGYGANGAGSQIPPYATLIFKVELLGIE